MMSRMILVCLAALIASIVAASAQEKKAPEPAGAAAMAPSIGEMIVQTIPAKAYFAAPIDTDFKSMGQPIVKNLTAMQSAAKDIQLVLTGPVVHVYEKAPHRSPEKPFRMRTGWFVPEQLKKVGPYPVQVLPEFRCASLLYVGPGAKIGEGWQRLYRAALDKGLDLTGEERELTLYWEGVDSPNNVVQMQIGIK